MLSQGGQLSIRGGTGKPGLQPGGRATPHGHGQEERHVAHHAGLDMRVFPRVPGAGS